MQDETALYGAKMMQPGMTAADSEENNLRPQHLEDYIGPLKSPATLPPCSPICRRAMYCSSTRSTACPVRWKRCCIRHWKTMRWIS